MGQDIFNKTSYFHVEAHDSSTSAILTVFDGSSEPFEIDLAAFGKEIVIFGRDEQNDIVIRSRYVSHQHGRFKLSGGNFIIENNPNSTNGLIFNGMAIQSRILEDGDSIRIDDGVESTTGGVLLVFSKGRNAYWKTLNLSSVTEITIGRGESCDIRLDHISVSRLHAKIVAKGNTFYLIDSNSTNGVMVNGKKVDGRVQLHEKDLILITNSRLIYSSKMISFYCYKSGISVESLKIVKQVGRDKIICNGVDLLIQPCEMVAIVGGSGAGKSTVMNCLSGYSQPTKGSVVVSGLDLYENFDALKNIIGYVPQSDIVYDNLSVFDMLHYAAQLRLPKDVSKSECLRCISDVLNIVGLENRKNTLIKNLSGGQRKRTSIAVELLSDPNLFFLDEPASGLDPGTERNLMKTLKSMSTGGKTVVFVTHSTLNLHLCDKIAFMGAGGNLCFYGSYNEALKFFGVDDIVDVYNLIANEPDKWKIMYLATQRGKDQTVRRTATIKNTSNKAWPNQTAILCKRYLHILLNDKVRLLLLLLQAPLLAALISLVANGNQYVDYKITKSLLFALSCSAFWVGILNSIQEVCKERNILKREYMTGLRLDTYVMSKMLVMALICFSQSLMLTTVFACTAGLPSKGVFLGAFLEILITVFLTALAASAVGIYVSSLFKNTDRVMTVAPLLLMPQLLFSGLIFELSGASQIISYLAVCRWSMESLGSTANLNALETITKEGLHISNKFEAFFEFTQVHLLSAWAILGCFFIIFTLIAGLVLKNINKERNA